MARSTDKRWKGILIDWDEISDMDAEDYELKPLNQQQTAILLALLEYQKWPTRWINLGLSQDELETYIADIEQRLMRNEGGMATQEDIAKGMYQAMNWLALQIASGSYANVNISTDEEGVVTLPSGSGEPPIELPDDDPSTPIDEQESARFGAMVEIAEKLEAILDKADALYGTTNNMPVTVEADAKAILKPYFPCDETAMEAAVTAYYAYRVSLGQLLFQPNPALEHYLFCNGYDYNTLSRYLIDVAVFPVNKMNIILGFWAALSDKFYSDFYAKGAAKPTTGYLDSACVPMPYQEHSDIPYNSIRNLLPTNAKGGHRLKIRASGWYVDGSEIQDAFWYRNAAGVLVRSNFTFSHAAGANMPSDSQVPYNTSHIYEYTIDLAAGVSSWSVQFPRNANMDVASTSPTNGFKIQITDLGLAVSQ